jgi:hypothetical protein
MLSSARCARGQQDKTYQDMPVKSNNHLFLYKTILHWNIVLGSMRLWTQDKFYQSGRG